MISRLECFHLWKGVLMFTNEIQEALKYYPADENGFVHIGVLRTLIGRQSQYLAFHFAEYGSPNSPYFDEGLRVIVPSDGNYHGIQIHKDDIEDFLTRYYEVYPRP